MLPGVVVFMRGFNPKEILRQIRYAPDLSTVSVPANPRYCGSICFKRFRIC